MVYVKNTMIFNLVNVLIPHYCCSCGKIGEILCEYCKYNIISEPFSGCIVCRKASSDSRGICSTCQTAYKRAWVVGERSEAIEKLIDKLKFERVRAAHKPLASLLDATLPILDKNITVVPVPTTRKHTRIRGYDHTKLLAKEFSRLRGLKFEESLSKLDSKTQLGATRKQRLEQAKVSYAAKNKLKGGIYLLIDDVVTTGATIEYASRALLDAGADQVWVAVTARQPLKK